MVVQIYNYFGLTQNDLLRANLRSVRLAAMCLVSIMLVSSCGNKSGSTETVEKIEVPAFNADSAYSYVKQQVDFGPRVPESNAHDATVKYLVAQLTKSGAKVSMQSFTASTFDGKKWNMQNIIGSFYPDRQKRILLAAHYDTRPFADKDSLHRDAPFDGANDGASGVGVLLEIARVLRDHEPSAGVDIIFFDGEDYGEKEGMTLTRPAEGWDGWWCLGSQYWSKNKHKGNYRAYYGILLDMVGGENSRFFQEGTSVEYAREVVDKVWSTAARIGFSDVFVPQKVGAITDDHYFVSALGKVPMIDIVPYDGKTFGSFHHTTHDNMSIISKRTLGAVGSTVLCVIFQEN